MAARKSTSAVSASQKKEVKTAAKKKSTEAKVKTPKATHPASSVMIIEAVTTLQEPKGSSSSLQAIKNYIAENYDFPIDKRTSGLLRKAIVKLVEEEQLIRVKGTGANGSFKLPKPSAAPASKSKEVKPPKEKAVPKIKAPAKVKKSAVEKKAAKPKVVKPKSPKTLKPAVPKAAAKRGAPKQR